MRQIGGKQTHNIFRFHIPCVGDPPTGEELYHRDSPMGVGVLLPHQAPQAQSSTRASRAFGFEGHWGLTAGAPQNWEKYSSFLKK